MIYFSAIYFYILKDDTISYVTGNGTEEVVSEFNIVAEKLLIWFAQIKLRANFDKFHLLLITTDAFNFQISETIIHNSHLRKLLGQQIKN